MRKPGASHRCVCGQTWSEHGAGAGWKPCQHPVTDRGRCMACGEWLEPRLNLTWEDAWDFVRSMR